MHFFADSNMSASLRESQISQVRTRRGAEEHSHGKLNSFNVMTKV